MLLQMREAALRGMHSLNAAFRAPLNWGSRLLSLIPARFSSAAVAGVDGASVVQASALSEEPQLRSSGKLGRADESALPPGLSGETPPDPEELNDSAPAFQWRHLFRLRNLAWGVALSLAAHGWALWLVNQIIMPGEPLQGYLLESGWTPAPEEIEKEVEAETHLAYASDETAESMFSAEMISLAPDNEIIEPAEAIEEFEGPIIAEDTPELDLMVPENTELDSVIVQYGQAGEAVSNVEGAIDRITQAVAEHLEQGPVLVVWLMDASISLVEQREGVATRLERIYAELDASGYVSEDALVASVVSFGAEANELVKPTTDGAEVVSAIRQIPVDNSGIENVFSTVAATVNRYKHFRNQEGRQILLVIWTDESGNDYAQLENAITACRRVSVPVYTVGPSAMFGLEKGTHAYVHPQNGKTYQLDVDRGPDAVRRERLRLPYWFEGDQYEKMTSGLGPFALTRLSLATGGAYFIFDQQADRSEFAAATMIRYAPEYVSPQEYLKGIQKSKLRTAVVRAVEISHQRQLKGTPRLVFAPTADDYQDQMREAQETVAFNAQALEMALNGFNPEELEEDYLLEKSPRWKAWYDLTFGRLLAMRVRCDEYNWACAEMKGRGREFVQEKSNRWEFVPANEIRFGTNTKRRAEEAIRLLTRCVQQNEGTPWGLLAERELRDSLGFQVKETYVAPPKPPEMPRMPANPVPPPRPQRPRRVTEQPRMLPRPEEPPVDLPKL